MERIPVSLLQGTSLHCRPMEDGSVIQAAIISSEGQMPTAKMIIVCPERISRSRCRVRTEAGDGDGLCHYYKGDSRGDYQIIGPGLDKKIGREWT